MNTKVAKEAKAKTERKGAMDGDQEKLNVAMKQHLELMTFMWSLLRTLTCLALLIGGYVYMLKTHGCFGDVPMLIGAYGMFKSLTN